MIADEVYGHLAFGDKPFVPMGVFGSTVPVLTLGSLSKRWIVPGWRLGWLVTSDPNSDFKEPKVLSPSLSLSLMGICIHGGMRVQFFSTYQRGFVHLKTIDHGGSHVDCSNSQLCRFHL